MLRHADKRQRYDRDVMRTKYESPVTHAAPQGSYASSGPAGGRPASGLSRRRTHFRGPPPSFYRSGGWGAQGTKRQAAHDETSSAAYTGAFGHQKVSMGGRKDSGKHPVWQDNDVPHFDRDGHFRTHTNHEQRRQSKRPQNDAPAGPESSTLANFLFVGSIISMGIFIPSLVLEKMNRKNN